MMNMMNIDIVDSIDEKINLFNETYDTDIIAVFPDKKEIYVRDMGQFLKALFDDWDDEVFVDTDHNLRQVSHSPMSEGTPYQVFLKDEYTGYTIIGEYETESAAKEAIESCIKRQYNVRVAMSYELSVMVTASSLSEAEEAAHNFCWDSMNLENRYTFDDNIDEWDIDDSNVEIIDSELA